MLHQRLAELATHDNHAIVIEAAYADFLNPNKVHHYTPASVLKRYPRSTFGQLQSQTIVSFVKPTRHS